MISIGPVSVGKLPVIVAGAAVVFVVAKGGPALLGLATGGAKKGYDDDMARYDEMIRRLSAPKGAPTAVASRARASPPKADEPVPPPSVEKQKKAKPAGIGLFKRKHVRPLDIDDVLGADGPAAAFAPELVSSLASHCSSDRFVGYVLSNEGGDAEALKASMEAAGMTAASVAELLASAVSAMLIPLVDDAVGTLKKGGEGSEETMQSLSKLQGFMAHAGELFEILTPGAAIKPVK